MDVPPEIAFRGIEPTDSLKALILEGIDSLEKVHPRLTSCRVMVEDENRGFPHVRLDIGVPGSGLVVHNASPVDPASRGVPAAIREAFDAARRQLREHRKRVTVDGKRGEPSPHGRILRLIHEGPDGRHGFLLSGDGREIYFHENALRDVSYEELEEGMEVRFVHAGGGGEGTQATSVHPMNAAETIPSEARLSESR